MSATAAFGYAGNLVLPGFGGIIGGVIGGLIDQKINEPNDSGTQTPPNRDLKLSAADEGAPLATVFGTARVPCTVRWVSRLREQAISNPGGGKGGQGANFLTYKYKLDVAYAVADGEIEEIEAIYANGKRIYNVSGLDVISSFTPDEGVIEVRMIAGGFNPLPSGWGIVASRITLKSPSGGPDLTQFTDGGTVEMSGWTGAFIQNNTANSALWTPLTGWTTPTVFSTRWDDATGDSYVTIQTTRSTGSPFMPVPTPIAFLPFPNGTGGQTIEIRQTNPKFSSDQIRNGIAFYNGDGQQLQDPTILPLAGLDGLPAYRHTAYFVLGDLEVTDFGNAPPQICEALVRRKTNERVSDVIRYVCEKAGLEPGEIDASACDDIICLGMYYMGSQSARDVLEPVLIAYDILVQARDGVLHFFPREDVADVTVDPDDLAAHEFGSDASRDLTVTDINSVDLPREINLSYRDPERGYQTGTQRVRRAFTRADVARSIDLPIVMSADSARSTAARILWLSHMNARRVVMQLPPKYISTVRESVRLNFTYDEQPFRVLTDQVDRGDHGVLRIEGVMEDPRLLAQPLLSTSAATTRADGQPGDQFLPPDINWMIFDEACLDDGHVDQPGFYWGAMAPGTASGIRVALFESNDDGATFAQISVSHVKATMGAATTTASATAIPGLWDDASVMTVGLDYGELESVTKDQCMSGMNRAVLGGGEVIGFATATLVAHNTYELTQLLRGLQGTESHIGEREDGETFLLVSHVGLEFVPINAAAIGQTRQYKAVPAGGRLNDYEAREFAIGAGNVRPLAPVHISATRDATDNMFVTFTRRSRGVVSLFGTSDIPSHEPEDVYVVEVMDKATATTVVRRTLLGASADQPVVTASTVDQTADGYTPGDPINLRISTSSRWIGDGISVEVTV